MKFSEIQEACWTGYRQAGMKKKGDRMVPNCVPVAEVKTGPEMTLNDLLYTAAAKAMHQAGLEGVPMDYEEAIKKAARIYRIPYTPSELPRLLAQRAEIDRKLAMLKQGKQVAKARRKEKLAPTPAGAEEYWKTHALPTDRIKPPAKTLEEYTGDPFIDNAARELLGMVLMFGVPFAIGTFVTLRNKLRKYQGKEIIDALERKGVTMNRQTYDKVKPVLDRFDQAIRDDDGAEARALAKQIEQMIIMGKLSAPEPRPADTALAAKEKELAEDLKKWFKEKWVRFGPDGKIRGACARGSEKEGKPKCLPQSKAHALGKKGRAAAAAKKRREDPNPERRGPARNVATKVKEQHDWDDADEFGMPGSEFFPDDDRLRDGDYVRDRQDGEYGEIFRMSGDPTERRVRILDRDGKGWYISPERLAAVDRNDPDIMKYFGKQRRRDMDEAVTLDRNKVPDYPRDPVTVKHRTDTAKAILSDPKSDPDSRKQAAAIVAKLNKTGVAEGFEYGSRVQHPKYGAGQIIKVYSNGVITVNFPNYPDPIDKKPGVQSNFAPGDKDYQSLKPMVAEKQDACYRKVKSRYKVWPSAYASGALVQCRKKGAANWGTGGKKKK